jgi:IclR family mhp operon transcriptional activator
LLLPKVAKFRITELDGQMRKPVQRPESVQPVIRSLRVLEALNDENVSSLARLHKTTGLPKPTLVRLLDTLIAAGYVHRVSRQTGYRLAERVLRLSSGFRYADLVVEAARPFLSALTAEHKWAVSLATCDGDTMLVRASTLQESPLAIDPAYINRRIPMLMTAVGRAYIAFCPQAERDAILATLRASEGTFDAVARDEQFLGSLFQDIRCKGYASTAPFPGEQAMGLAVPLMQGEKVIACMTLRYFSSAMSEQEAARRYLAPMQKAARSISALLAE